MLPAYNAQGFAGVDLRKYHIRDVKDCIRFVEFVSSRMEEAKHVLNKFNTQHNTLQAVVKQMQSQQQKINDMYGAPTQATETKEVEDKEKAVIQTVEEKKDTEEKEALLNELRQATANEEFEKAVSDEDKFLYEDAIKAELDKYKAVKSPRRVMYYREGKLIKDSEVPEDIKQTLTEALDEQLKLRQGDTN